MRTVTTIGLITLFGGLAAATAATPLTRTPQSAVTHHVLHLRDRSVPYTATVAENFVAGQSGVAGAAVITIAYTRDDVNHANRRPIMFAFNGGPGASSSPLHMSALGPMGRNSSALAENPDTPLDDVDLVFIDPVSTGFSRAFPGIDPKQWYSGSTDAIEVATVIKNWLRVNRREASPRYLVGESYGATRAGLILKYAPDLKWNGVLLISGGSGRAGSNSRDAGVIAPMAAGAWFHNKIDRKGRSVQQIFAEAAEFARGEYAGALAENELPAEQAHAVAEKLSALIGLPVDLIEKNKLRVSDNLYMFNLLKDQDLRTGLLDTRVTDALVTNAAGGIDDPALGVIKPQANGAVPTPESVGAVVSPTVGRYVSDELKFQTTEPYYGVNFKANVAWNYHAPDGTQEETTTVIISRVMTADSKLRLFTVSGFFDLNASDGSAFVEAGVPVARYTQLMLPGPHEVYEGAENHKAFNDAVRRFVSGSDAVPPKKDSAGPMTPREFVTHHSGVFGGHELRYSAIAGDTILTSDAGKQTAAVFSFTYLREDVSDRQKRPVLFVFNGGPGSSSLWQHLGFFGPKRVRLQDEVHPPSTPPFAVENNPHCLLDVADIVLIDPVGTGYSRLLPDGDAHDYYGVEQDGRATVEFIERWLRKYDRLNSPRIIAGESYGVTRAIVVARMLMGGPFSATGRLTAIPLNGIIIMGGSPSMEGPQSNGGSDLDYPNTLPTMAGTAWYHGKTSREGRSLDDAITEAKAFASGEYLNALYAGDTLDAATRSRIAKRLSELTGLPVPFVQARGLRIAMGEFRSELLRDQGLLLGAYDTRFTLPAPLNAGPLDPVADDPAMGQFSAAFVGALDGYLKSDLKINVDAPYNAIDFKTVNSKWDYDSRLGPAGPSTRAQDLAATMRRNPHLRLFSVSGAYDAVVPLQGVAYSLAHSGLPSDRVTIRTYPAGHMAYLGDAPSKALAEDLRKFLGQAVGQ